jgi:hypothetical protein
MPTRSRLWGACRLLYDDNENLGSTGCWAYTWNERNKLTAISGGVSASFGYDGAGLPV